MCSAIISGGGRRSFGRVAITASHAPAQHGEGAVAFGAQLGVVRKREAGFEHGREVGWLVAGEGKIGSAHSVERLARGRAAFVPGCASEW